MMNFQRPLQLLLTFTLASAIPVQHLLEKGTTECLYGSFQMNEQITSSIFITAGEELKVKTSIQGPIAQMQISSSAEVLAAAMRLDKVGKKSNLKLDYSYEIDFQNLFNDDAILQDDDFDDDYEAHMDDEIDDIVYQDYYYMDDDDEYEFMIDDAMDDMEIQEVKKAKEARDALSPQEKADRDRKKQDAKKERMESIKREMEAKRKRKEEDLKNKRKAKLDQKKEEMKEMNQGKAVERTYKINEEGWYRFCVDASYSDAEVEMELRSSSELGAPNSKTGHVQTYERHDMLMNEKKLMAKMNAASKEGGSVKEEDLKKTKELVTKMNRLLNEIREKQVNERHRLGIHKAINERSHSRMVVNSLFETVFYIAISGFQVYTIRKWFSGNPILAY